MAQLISIPITDHDDECTTRYTVEYKEDGAIDWISAPDQFESPVTISALADATDYNYRITRYCCNGLVSAPATGNFTSGS